MHFNSNGLYMKEAVPECGSLDNTPRDYSPSHTFRKALSSEYYINPPVLVAPTPTVSHPLFINMPFTNAWNFSSPDNSSAMNTNDNSDASSQFPYYATHPQDFQTFSLVPTAQYAVGQPSSSLYSDNRVPQSAYPEQHHDDASSYYYPPPAWPGASPYAPSSFASTSSPSSSRAQSQNMLPIEVGYRAANTFVEPMMYHPRPKAPAPILPLWTDMPLRSEAPYTEQRYKGPFDRDAGAVALTTPPKKKKAKMHRCEICNHDFPRPSGLRTHMNSHNGIRPFPCTFPGCEKTFGVRSNMKRHLRTHGPPPPEIDYWQLEYPDSGASTPHDTQSIQRPDSAIRTTQRWSPANASQAEAGYSSSEYDEMDNASNGSYSEVQLSRRNATVPPSDANFELHNQKTATRSSFAFSQTGDAANDKRWY